MKHDKTSLTLIELAKSGRSESWNDLQRLYLPLVYHWAVVYNSEKQHREEIVTNVFGTISIKIKSFQHNGRTGAFRNWIRMLTRTEVANYYRKINREPVAVADLDSFSETDDAETNHEEISILYRQALEMIKEEFSPRDVEIFVRVAQYQDRAVEVAKELDLQPSNVYRIVSNIKSRIRERFAGELE